MWTHVHTCSHIKGEMQAGLKASHQHATSASTTSQCLILARRKACEHARQHKAHVRHSSGGTASHRAATTPCNEAPLRHCLLRVGTARRARPAGAPAMRPCTWKSGMTSSERSDGCSSYVPAMLARLHTTHPASAGSYVARDACCHLQCIL